MSYKGDFPVNGMVDFKWNTAGANGTSITRGTNGSIRIYKNNSTTERTSAAGITDTEDFDTLTGVHHLRIDLSDNTDAGFYAAGNEYQVVLQGAVIDSQTVNAVIAEFSIERAGGALALLKDATFGLAQLESLVDDLESRLTATRAGYLDNLSAGPAATQASVDVIDDFLDTEVTDIRNRLPSALIGGRMDSTVSAINNIVAAAQALAASAQGLVSSTCASGSTTTNIVTNLTEATDDHYNGRAIVFTGGALVGQAASIFDYNGTTKALTVSQLTEAPANTDPFVIV
jgi:hypothetical protein